MSLDVQSASATRPLANDSLADPAINPALTSSGAVPTGSYRLEPSYHPQLANFNVFGTGGARAPANVSFEAEVAGQGSQAIDLELMQISNAVYDPSVTQVGNWTRVSDADLQAAGIDPALFETPDTGFRAGLYSNDEGQYVLAFAGSNERIDWTDANLVQGLGFDAEQYDQAATLAQQVGNSEFGRDDNFIITGHSLGGGLGATAALASDTTAVTFNASGVHDKTLERLGLDPAQAKLDAEQGQIRRYNISGDPLTGAQEDVWGSRSIMPDAPGHEINLSDPYPAIPGPDLTDWPWVVAGNVADYAQAKVERTGALHGQQSVLDALQQQRPWE